MINLEKGVMVQFEPSNQQYLAQKSYDIVSKITKAKKRSYSCMTQYKSTISLHQFTLNIHHIYTLWLNTSMHHLQFHIIPTPLTIWHTYYIANQTQVTSLVAFFLFTLLFFSSKFYSLSIDYKWYVGLRLWSCEPFSQA